jgi:GTPase SAR1 family protein
VKKLTKLHFGLNLLSEEAKNLNLTHINMGICSSTLTEADLIKMKASKDLENKIRIDAMHDEDKVKLLLLGAGESGKSTIFKQMKIIYGKEFTDTERKDMIPTVFLNIIQSIKFLCEQLVRFGMEDRLSCKDDFILVRGLDDSDDITLATGDAIRRFWLDPVTQECWARRSEYQIIESVKYYFERIDIIKMPNYIPDKDDILHTRVRTSGIVTERYFIDASEYEMYDVGGQKNERKKWIHCFENVTAVIFVAAISEYDQKLFEDGSTNRMVDALELFKEICTNHYFRKAAIILFLNKKDLFESKIKKCPIRLSEPFKDYNGPDGDYDAGVTYFVKKFKDLNTIYSEREIYHHVTCATDTSNVRLCFDLCKDIIMNNALSDAGF